MSSGSYFQVDVLCPYYVSDNGRDRITCEGVLPGSQTQSYFRANKDFITQIRCFCCAGYFRCEICETLDKKYEEE